MCQYYSLHPSDFGMVVPSGCAGGSVIGQVDLVIAETVIKEINVINKEAEP